MKYPCLFTHGTRESIDKWSKLQIRIKYVPILKACWTHFCPKCQREPCNINTLQCSVNVCPIKGWASDVKMEVCCSTLGHSCSVWFQWEIPLTPPKCKRAHGVAYLLQLFVSRTETALMLHYNCLGIHQHWFVILFLFYCLRYEYISSICAINIKESLPRCVWKLCM